MQGALIVHQYKFFSTFVGRLTATIIAPIATVLLIAILGIIWLAVFIILAITCLCLSPLFGWFLAKNKSLTIFEYTSRRY